MIKLIVQIGIDRIDEIVEFEKLCFSSEAWSREQIIDVLNDKRTIYLCYEENEKINGRNPSQHALNSPTTPQQHPITL